MAKLKVPVGTADHAQGPADAPVTLVEYGDYECPHCGRAYPIVKALQKQFGPQLRFVFRNFPLRESHLHAGPAAETAEFAAASGRFWPMHDLLFENQESLGEPLFLKLARQLTLDANALEEALADHKFTERVQKDFAGGVRSGVNGTPTFFINGDRHDGDFELETLVDAVAAAVK